MSEALINTLEYKIDLKIIWSCELKNVIKIVIYIIVICFPLMKTNKHRELTDLHEHYLRNKRNVTFRQYIKVKKLISDK